MNNHIAYTEITAFVMHQLPTGTSFAVSEDNSAEQIFIPSQVARMQNLVPGDRVTVRAIPNKREGGAKWFAVFASILPREVEVAVAPVTLPPRIEEALAELDAAISNHTPTVTQIPAQPKLSVDWYASAKAALKRLGGVATSSEVAEECGCETQHISTYLRVLHERGEVCRAGVRTNSKQTKDSLVYWGLTLDDLIPAGMVEGK
jgi:exoribonuclease R